MGFMANGTMSNVGWGRDGAVIAGRLDMVLCRATASATCHNGERMKGLHETMKIRSKHCGGQQ
jgi:hypothetical protein